MAISGIPGKTGVVYALDRETGETRRLHEQRAHCRHYENCRLSQKSVDEASPEQVNCRE